MTRSLWLAIAAAWATERGLHVLIPGMRLWTQVTRVGAAIAAGVAVLVVAAHLLRIPEFQQAVVLTTARIRRRSGR